MKTTAPEPIRWCNERLELLDQRLLPQQAVYEAQHDAESVGRAIRELRVRGAPAIGIAAAYGLVVAMQEHRRIATEPFMAHLEATAAGLASARPTAVNLGWALARLLAVARDALPAPAETLYRCIRTEAERIHAEDRAMCRAIGAAGVALITPGCRVLTHCNAGALAVSELGTATAPLYLAHAAGVPFKVIATETRPLLQGARLTAWELLQAGIDTTLITDSMVARLFAEGGIDLVIVGTDRVVANGDTVNKIGTLGIALLAHHFGIPFYVALPASTYDASTTSGTDVVIEERDGDEVRQVLGRPSAPANVKVRNPAFDVTPHALVAAFITNVGLLRPPYRESLARLNASSGGAAVGRVRTD